MKHFFFLSALPTKAFSRALVLTMAWAVASLFPSLLFSQNLHIEGQVADSSGIGLPAASVVLLEKKDSLFVMFGLTDEAGRYP